MDTTDAIQAPHTEPSPSGTPEPPPREDEGLAATVRCEIAHGGRSFVLHHDNPDDHIFRLIRNGNGFYEPDLLALMGDRVAPGDLVVDVGANIGNHTVFLAGVHACRVLAVEPNPRALRLLRLNVEANGLGDRVEIAGVALGAAATKGVIIEGDAGNLGSFSVTPAGDGPIAMETLDGLLAGRRPAVIKIDTEGNELAILTGAVQTIAEHRPFLCLEITASGALGPIHRLLTAQGYALTGVCNHPPTFLFTPTGGYVAESDAALSELVAHGHLATHQAQLDIRNAVRRNAGALDHLQNQGERITAFLTSIHKDMQTGFGAADTALQGLGTGIAETLADAIIGIERRLDALAARLAAPPPPSRPVAGSFAGNPMGGSPMVGSPIQDAASRALAFLFPPAARPRPPVSGQERAAFDLTDGWPGWEGRSGALLEADGTIAIAPDAGPQPVAASPHVALPSGGLFRVSVAVAGDGSPDGQPAGLTLTVTDGGSKAVGPSLELRTGPNEATFFVSRRTDRLHLLLTVQRPAPDARPRIASVRVEALDPDSHYAAERAGRDQPVLASLASIPSRALMLRDCVDSLLVQCDRVRVFLNGYAQVPAFLHHPRVEVRRSQDWDDKGDAGKFFWIDEADEPGYRVVVDDDLLFPPDFAAVMTRKVASYGNRAFVALHGVLLKQPVTRYYDPTSRSVFHFETALAADRTVHVLGTNALCYHSGALGLRWADFMHRNMADIFLARYAQENGIPMIAPSRPWLWVRQNGQPGGFETIYEHSLKRTRSRFDSSAVQDAVVKAIGPLTLQPSGRPKLVVCLCATGMDRLRAALDWWVRNRPGEADRVLIVADGTPDDDVARDLAQRHLDDELHIVRRTAPAAALLAALELARRLGGDEVLVLTDGLRLNGPDWYNGLLAMARASGGVIGLTAVQSADGGEAPAGGTLRLGPGLLAPSTVLWFGRRPPPSSASVPPPSPAETLPEALTALFGPGALEPVAAPLPVPHPPAPDGTPGPVAARLEGTDLATLAVTGFADPPFRRTNWAPGPPCPPLGVNEMFERVLLLNLDRRPDRLAAAERRLERAGIQARRFRAVDAAWPEVQAEYLDYLRKPLVARPLGVRPVPESFEFFNDYDSQTARVAFVEHDKRRKAIQSAGAWGYLRSMERILEDALKDRVESLLVFDDDVLFHRRARELFAVTASHLPPDWLIFQLGTLQYHWEEPWMSWAGPLLYRSNGVAAGSYAVGVRFDLLPFLLEQTRRRELPYDTGALSAALRAFPDRNYVACPNIAIRSMQDSDIQSSAFQKTKGPETATLTYRWTLEDYER